MPCIYLCWVWGEQSCKCLCQEGDVSVLVDDMCGMSESERNEWLEHFHEIIFAAVFGCCHLLRVNFNKWISKSVDVTVQI